MQMPPANQLEAFDEEGLRREYSLDESQREFVYGERDPLLSISAVVDMLQSIDKRNPWTAFLAAASMKNASLVGDMEQWTQQEALGVLKVAKFDPEKRTPACDFLCNACNITWALVPAPDEEETLAVPIAQTNVQKLTKRERTTVFGTQAKMDLFKLLKAICIGLKPVPLGGSIDYNTRIELGARMYIGASRFLPDSSQRHNLCLDVRRFLACFCNFFYPFHDDSGLDGYLKYFDSRWRNNRTGSFAVPSWMYTSENNLEFFGLTELKEAGHLRLAGNKSHILGDATLTNPCFNVDVYKLRVRSNASPERLPLSCLSYDLVTP